MYEVIIVTVLATISVLLGLSFVLPDTTTPQHVQQSIPEPEIPKEQSEPNEPGVSSAPSPTQFSSSCYDAIAVRERGRVYIFQSKHPLQEGVNPLIFSDLPSYRVWAEQSLGDDVKCPVLYYDSTAEPYIHPEEKYAGDVSMIRSSKRAPHAASYMSDTREVHDESTLMGTRDKKSSYVRSAVMEPARYVAADGVVDSVSPPIPPYAEASGKVHREMRDDMITRSQREAIGAGADEPAPVPPRNTLRDVPQSEVVLLAAEMEEKDPSMKGVVLKRTGYSKYEVDEVIPENVVDSGVRSTFGMGNTGGLDIDLLAYGGTVVPVKNVNRLFG